MSTPHLHERLMVAMSTLALLIAATIGLAQDESESTKAQEAQPDLHWAVQLGLRVHQLDRAIGIVDQVVLVPDEATYLQELTRWSPQARWPVLIEDDHLTPMFIRRFSPARVLRRQAAAHLPDDPEKLKAILNGVVIKALGGDPQTHSLASLLAANAYAPPGIVATSITDPARIAAVTLAAGRAQPLAWLEGDFGQPHEALPVPRSMALMEEVRSLLDSVGLPWNSLGDVVETLTICRTMAGRMQLNMPEELLPPIPSRTQGVVGLATMDVLGRTEQGERGVFASWIFGDARRCAYVSMCSLFLPRTRVTLADTYDLEDANTAPYRMTEPAKALEALGYEVVLMEGRAASEIAWQRLLAGGLTTDLLMMNSKGIADEFGLRRGKAFAVDVPILNTPASIDMIHSFSMRSPGDATTVAGAWLSRGSYAYVGSVLEPYLAAFVPTIAVVERMVNFVPFIVSCRWWPDESPFALPWRVNTFGDPLMLAPAPARSTIERLSPPDDDELTVRQEAARALRAARKTGSAEGYAKAIRLLILIGEDAMAINLWRSTHDQAPSGSAARLILGPLFRAKDQAVFLQAWALADDPTALDRDMLWHLVGSDLNQNTDPDIVVLLSKNLRWRSRGVDLTRLAPHLARVQGRQAVHDLAAKALESTRNKRAQDRLKKLIEAY